MAYQPRIKSPRSSVHQYRKPLRERRKDKKRNRHAELILEEKHTATERELSEVTLKRLHTLGKQKFGSSPFNQHYDRWLANVEAVLGEFESHPNITVDDQYLKERSQALDIIKLQFQDRRRKEDSIDQQLRVLSHWRSLLKQIDAEYANIIQATKSRKNAETKRLQANIANLKSEQDRVIRIKTGFFRGISERDREQNELEIAQQLSDIQTKLELALLDFNAEQKALRQQCEAKREPVLEQIKHFQKTIRDLETDGSLEERWFACEALIDAMNSFLLRKTTQPQNNSSFTKPH